MKVYVLTSGCYSDYHICAVTLDKEKAELYAKEMSSNRWGDSVDIEEYETDDLSSFEAGMSQWCIRFTEKEHNVVDVYKESYPDQIVDPFFNNHTHLWSVGTYAIDEEHAIKSASDRLSIYLAKQAGIC